jgi:hypothetical protein
MSDFSYRPAYRKTTLYQMRQANKKLWRLWRLVLEEIAKEPICRRLFEAKRESEE